MKDFLLKNKKIILIAAAVAVVLIAGIVIACVAGGNQPGSTEPTGEVTNADYSILVQNGAGEPVANVKVFVYTDAEKKEMIWAAVTDATGKITFNAPTSDRYVTVLENVPASYGCEDIYALKEKETIIVLKDLLLNETDMKISFELGDSMMDFSVLDCDGVEHQLSALLQEKKAVVLNFWYLNCTPCKMEFPYLQEAYGIFSNDIAVLAMNPIDGDDASVSQFRTENGLTFPMAKVDEKWTNVQWAGISAISYPTTIVIDREGKISMIHQGMVTETQTFLNMFGYYTAEDYTSKVVNNVEELPVYEIKNSAENPLEISGVTSFNITVKPGEKMYVNVYNVADMLMSIESSNVYVEYNGQTYNSENGSLSLMVDSPNPFTPVALAIGNNGSEAETFTATFTYPEGSMGNPYELSMGQFIAQLPAGHDTGMYYTFTAIQPGKLSIKLISATKGVEYDVAVTNKTTMAIKTLGEDAVDGVITVDVSTGDVIEVSVGTFMDSQGQFPAADIKLEAAFDNGGLAAPMDYTVTVKNETGAGVKGVSVSFVGDGINQTVVTDNNGVAKVSLPAGSYTCNVAVPTGYKTSKTSYDLTETVNKVTVTMESTGGSSTGTTNPTDPSDPSDPTTPTTPVVQPEPDPKIPGETKEFPLELTPPIDGSDPIFEVTVRAGWVCYLEFPGRLSGNYLEIVSENAQVKWKGKTYKPSNGKITIMLNSEGTFTPISVQLTNKGDEAETFTIRLIAPAGSMGAPYILSLGEFTAKVPAGSDQGIYYEYTATATGTLTVDCLSSTNGVSYKYFLQNLTQATATQPEIEVEAGTEGAVTLSIQVKKGDKIRFSIGTMPESGDNYPAGEFEMKASFEKS